VKLVASRKTGPLTEVQERIIKWRKKGWKYEEICDKVDVSMSYVFLVLKRAGLVIARKKKRKKTK